MRTITVLLSALALGGLLQACGGDDESAPASASTTGSGGAACDTVKIAELDSPEVHASYYAIDQGIVTDDRVGEVDVDYLAIPALVQSTGSDRYDVTSAALNGILFVREQTGEDFRVIAFKQALDEGSLQIWKAAGSDVESPSDLDGRTLGVSGLGSTNVMAAQLLLQNRYGVDAQLKGGSVGYTDLDPPTLMKALKDDQVDGGLLIHYPNWQALSDGEVEPLVDVSSEYADEFGAKFIGAGLIVSPDTLEEKADCIAGLQKMLRESAQYAHDHIDEVAPAVSEALAERQLDVPPEYLEYWFDHNDYGSSVDAEWLKGADVFWEKASEMGLVPEAPKAADIVVAPQDGA